MIINKNIFEYLGLEGDPIYQKLQKVNEGDSVQIDGYVVKKEKYFEIENDELHLGFKDLESCYQFLSGVL